ncbi:MAG TPA: hypothetical protein VFG49_16395 [Dyella sp.]|nr:hypothetical protein [Dyella sp.]HET6555106.1 hypothetical protein [Dyella sp.]
MHPIWHAILMEPVGWLAIGGSIVMVTVGIAVACYVRRKVREEEVSRPR